MTPALKAPEHNHLQPEHEESLFYIAFNCNFRGYILGAASRFSRARQGGAG
jgi:hypothetical protein